MWWSHLLAEVCHVMTMTRDFSPAQLEAAWSTVNTHRTALFLLSSFDSLLQDDSGSKPSNETTQSRYLTEIEQPDTVSNMSLHMDSVGKKAQQRLTGAAGDLLHGHPPVCSLLLHHCLVLVLLPDQ